MWLYVVWLPELLNLIKISSVVFVDAQKQSKTNFPNPY